MALFVTFSTHPQPLSGTGAPAVSRFSRSVPFRAMVEKATKMEYLQLGRSMKRVTKLGMQAPTVKQLREVKDATRSNN